MIEVNLLPKELQKRARAVTIDKTIVYIAAGVAAVLVLMIAIVVFQKMKISDLDNKIAEAKAETERLRKDIELVDRLEDLKDKLVSRMRAIEELERNRAAWVALMEDLSSKVPDYLWLTSMTQQASPEPGVYLTTFEGLSFSLNSLATFMIQVMRSDFFSSVDLTFIRQASEEQGTFSFQITANLSYEAGLAALLPVDTLGTATSF
jgi:type IV pilus assembly protein PilN